MSYVESFLSYYMWAAFKYPIGPKPKIITSGIRKFGYLEAPMFLKRFN